MVVVNIFNSLLPGKETVRVIINKCSRARAVKEVEVTGRRTKRKQRWSECLQFAVS